MVARKVVVDDDICNEDGSIVNPRAAVQEFGQQSLPPGLAPIKRPKISQDSNYNRAVYQLAKKIARRDSGWNPAIVQQLLTSPTPAQERILAKYRNKAASAPRDRQAPPPRPVRSQPATRRAPEPTRNRLPPKPKQVPRRSAKIRVGDVEIDDFFAEETGPRKMPKTPVKPKSTGLAALRAMVNARAPERVKPKPQRSLALDAVFSIERLTAEPVEALGLLQLTPEGSDQSLQIPYHWVIPTKECFVVVIDTRTEDCDIGVDVVELQEFDRLFLEFNELGNEPLSTTVIGTVYQFEWGAFRFIQFLLAD